MFLVLCSSDVPDEITPTVDNHAVRPLALPMPPVSGIDEDENESDCVLPRTEHKTVAPKIRLPKFVCCFYCYSVFL